MSYMYPQQVLWSRYYRKLSANTLIIQHHCHLDLNEPLQEKNLIMGYGVLHYLVSNKGTDQSVWMGKLVKATVVGILT